METEFEAKFYPVDKEKFRAKLKLLRASLTGPERKFRRIMGDRSANPQLSKNDFLRVRDEGDVKRLSFKRTADPNGKLTDQQELDIVVSDFEKTIEIFKLTGFKFNRYQETLRESWLLDECEVVIDSWPGLQSFAEIEGKSEAKVQNTCEKLAFQWSKKIISSTVEIYEKVYNLPQSKVLDMVSNITFENNPFEGLTKVWNGD